MEIERLESVAQVLEHAGDPDELNQVFVTYTDVPDPYDHFDYSGEEFPIWANVLVIHPRKYRVLYAPELEIKDLEEALQLAEVVAKQQAINALEAAPWVRLLVRKHVARVHLNPSALAEVRERRQAKEKENASSS